MEPATALLRSSDSGRRGGVGTGHGDPDRHATVALAAALVGVAWAACGTPGHPDADAGAHLASRRRSGSRAHAVSGDHRQRQRAARRGSSPNYHGYGALWTALPPGVIDEGGTPEPGGWTSQKYPWWTVGTTGELTIQGRRVDARRRHCAPGPAAGCPKPPSLRFPAAAFGPAGSTRVPRSVGTRPFARA